MMSLRNVLLAVLVSGCGLAGGTLLAVPAAAQTVDLDDVTQDINDISVDGPTTTERDDGDGEESDADSTVNPDAEPRIDPDSGRMIHPDRATTIDPDSGRTINPDAERTINPDADRTIDPDAERTINPDAEPTINPDAEPAINPDAEPTINPDAEPTINPDAEPVINPDRGRVIRPDAPGRADASEARPPRGAVFVAPVFGQQADFVQLEELQAEDLERFASSRRGAFVEFNERLVDDFDRIQDTEEIQPDGVDVDRLAGNLDRMNAELNNMEAAYSGLGRQGPLDTVEDIRRDVRAARQNVARMQNAPDRQNFRNAANAFNANLQGISAQQQSLPR